MELLLTVLIWLWQIGWVLLLGGLICAALVWCIKPLRRHKVLAFAACAAAVCVLRVTLCARPVVLYDGSSEETEQIRQLAAGPYSNRVPLVPVCAVVREAESGMTVQVWYAFVGSMTYAIDGEGLPSIVDWLFPWQ